MKRCFCLLLILLILMPVCGPSSLAETETQALRCDALDLALFKMDETTVKISLDGLTDAFSMLDGVSTEKGHTYQYALQLAATNDLLVYGRITFQNDDSAKDWRINARMLCKQRNYDDGAAAYITGDDTVNWKIELSNFFARNFSFQDVSQYVFTLNKVGDRSHQIEKTFAPDDVLTNDILKIPQKRVDGMLRMEVPEEKTLRIYLEDPDIQTDYRVSPGGKGKKTAKWQIKAVISSYLWVEAWVDGSKADDLEHMLFYAGEFHLGKYEMNKYSRKTIPVESASYRIEGNTLIIEIQLPDSLPHDFRKLQYVEVATKGRDIFTKYRISYN